MATILPSSSTNQIPPRLLANYPKIAETVPDDDEFVNSDGSAVVIPGTGAKFEVEVKNPLVDTSPVHENLCLAAAGQAKRFNSDNEWTEQYLDLLPNPKYELIRGVFFNDDPNCQLFEDSPYENRHMDLLHAADYGVDFKAAKFGFLDKNNLLYRSHFGNLQFIHAMGTVKGEAPQETRRKVRIWLQALYSVYSGQVSRDTLLKDGGLSEFFNEANGYGHTTFKEMLMGRTTSFEEPDISLRALGSCMHVVQDSFAKGHCHRDDNGSGAISNFHCYDGQDEHDHSHWDSAGGVALDPTDLKTFDSLYGARKAIDRCVEFLDAASTKQPWNNLLEKWFQDTFAISSNASASDTHID